jgi:hypothetical protein
VRHDPYVVLYEDADGLTMYLAKCDCGWRGDPMSSNGADVQAGQHERVSLGLVAGVESGSTGYRPGGVPLRSKGYYKPGRIPARGTTAP